MPQSNWISRGRLTTLDLAGDRKTIPGRTAAGRWRTGRLGAPQGCRWGVSGRERTSPPGVETE